MRRVRTSERDRLYNRFWKTRCKTVVKKVLDAVEAGNSELAVKCLNVAQSVLDKALVKGVIQKNTVAHRKSLITRKVKSLSPAPDEKATSASV